MRKMLYNITSGNPKILIKSVAASFLDGLMKIIPAILVYDVIYTIYQGMERGSVLDTDRLWKVCFGLFFMMVIQYVTAGLSYEQTFNAAYKTAAEGRIALAEHLRKLSLGFLSSKDPGDITTMMLSDYATVEQAISHYVPQLVSAAIFPVITFILLSFVNIKMALAMFLCLPVGVLIMALSSNIQKQLGQKHVKAKVESASRLQEYLQGIKEIKAHNLNGEKFQRLKIAFESLMKASIRLEGLIGPFVMVSILIIRSGLTFMIFVGAYELVGGSIDLPVFLGFLLLGTRVFEPITVVLTNFAELKYAVLSGERIMEITKESPLKGNLEVPKSSHISFENVSFGYEDARVLKGVSFEIPQKKMTALVGLSGSGKSTITKLIARFWDVDGGKISLGGEDIRNIKPEALLSQISMVFQDVYLFKDTVKNNIRVGKADATMKEIEEAAKLACCHEFIERLPLGYDTPIGEGGCTLSGGEKQRISIARALLKNAPIVLLDEATASLDPENEVHVQRALNQLVKEKTVVTIAHRLKTIQGADQIVVLDKGEIQAIGTHEELARAKGLYGTLWKLQQESSGWHIGA